MHRLMSLHCYSSTSSEQVLTMGLLTTIQKDGFQCLLLSHPGVLIGKGTFPRTSLLTVLGINLLQGRHFSSWTELAAKKYFLKKGFAQPVLSTKKGSAMINYSPLMAIHFVKKIPKRGPYWHGLLVCLCSQCSRLGDGNALRLKAGQHGSCCITEGACACTGHRHFSSV